MSSKSISTRPMIAFAIPGFLSAFIHVSAGSIVPTIYATEFGLTLALIGTALLISRSADVVIDPLIGWMSDRTGGRLGARKPWVILGVVLTTVSTWFLFAPPVRPSYGYFLFWYTLIYLAWSLIEIPHTAWGFEITRDYDGRARVVTVRQLAQTLAGLFFLSLPLLPFFKTTAITGATLAFIAKLTLVLGPLALIGTLLAPPAIPMERGEHYRLRDLISILRGNRPFWIFVAAFFFNGFSAGMFGALVFLYFSNYLGLANQFVILFAALALVMLVSLPIAPLVIRKFGKRRTWAGSMLLGTCVLPLILLVPKGPGALLPLLLINLPIGFANSLTLVAAGAVAGDVIDYDTWRTGQRRAAVYTAVLSFIVKLNAIPGGAVALLIVGALGYDPKLGPANGPVAALGLKIAFILAPTFFFGVSALFAWNFPIDRRQQQVIARRIETREARQQRRAAEGDEQS